MKTRYINILIIILTIMTAMNCQDSVKEAEDHFPKLTSKYIDIDEPGLTPKLFAPNIISTGMSEINATFSPDFKEFYYTLRLPNRKLVIMEMKYDGQKWSKPEVASFSGIFSDADPFISYDGKWLYYISRRPIDSTLQPKRDWDIWRVKKEDQKWSKPERLNGEINSELDETYPSLTKEGKLYFSSGRFGKNNKDIFCATPTAQGFDQPVKLNDTINSHWEGDIIISPNEDFMIFASYGRDSGSGLYISFRKDSHWSIPQRMADEINLTGREFCPILSPDGKYFFFTSSFVPIQDNKIQKLDYNMIKEDFINSYEHPQRGKTDVYWVSSQIIENYREEAKY